MSVLGSMLLAFGLASAGSAQSEELAGDVRVEMPEHGYAITFPADWLYDPQVVPVQAFAPEGPDGSRETCNIQFGDGFGLTAEQAIGFMQSGAYDASAIYGDGLLDGPHVSVVTLPVGDALRLSVDLMRDDDRLKVTSYSYDNGETVFELTCAGLERPDDLWLSVAETVTALPTDPVSLDISGEGTATSPPFDLVGGDYEVTFDKAEDCDAEFTYAILERSDGNFVDEGWVEENGLVHGIEDGEHYWDVEAYPDECVWSLTLRPL